MNTVLITGGAGFIGSNLAKKLITKGYSIRVLDNLSPQIHGKNPSDSTLYKSIVNDVTFINGTVTNKDDWRKALKGVDIVVHLAAETGTGQSMYEVEKYTDVNVGGTGLFLDILANEEHQVKKMVIASSRSIYGEGKYSCDDHGIVYPTERTEAEMLLKDFDAKCPICNKSVILKATDEESKIHPSSIYGITKQMQEQMFMVMGKSLNIPAVAFRYQNVYGPGQSLSNPYTGILSIFSTQIRNNNGIQIFEDGKESRDFVHINDVVDATILGIEKDEADNKVFNVGTGEAIDVLQVAQTLIKAYDIDVPLKVTSKFRLGDIRHNYADLSKITNKLGFKPQISFSEGIKEFTSWVLSQDIEEDNLEKSLNEMKSKGLLK